MTIQAQLLFAALSYAALWAISWWAAIARGWGAAESAHDPTSLWLYARRLLLIGLAAAGLAVGGAGGAALGWGLSPWLPAVVLLGVVLGMGNRGGFTPSGPAPIAVALFHTFATELYFRGYLFHHLATLIDLWALPLSALAYGAYYLTVHTVWAGGRNGRIAGVALFTFLGLIFAGAYLFTGSLLGAWLCHFAAVIRWREARGRRRPTVGEAQP